MALSVSSLGLLSEQGTRLRCQSQWDLVRNGGDQRLDSCLHRAAESRSQFSGI